PLIQQLSDDGCGVVVVSSEIPEVLGLADRVLVVADGTVLHDGPSADLDEHRVLDIILKGDAA
ncbi:MAG: sugar ABC transporter ATP-binding protein, partial [Intrasporangiaceae bacterium]|nr:sugar ABC transporter ATP-binding protein [Intrasporangiaceae bacterium]